MSNTKKNSNNNSKHQKKPIKYRKRAYKPQFIQRKDVQSIDHLLKTEELQKAVLKESEISDKIVDSLKQLCEEINSSKDENIPLITNKFCEIIEHISKSKQQSKLFNNVLFNNIVNSLKKLFLLSKDMKWYTNRVIILRTMSIVLFENSPLCEQELFNELINILIPFCDLTVVDKDIVRLATTCLGNICTKRGLSGKSYYNTIFDVLYRNYQKLIEDIKVSGNSKLLASTIRSIQLILMESDFYESHISSLVNSLSKLIYFGTSIFPIQSEFQDNDESSGSEYSGSDVYLDKFQTWKVRYHSIGCVQALVKCSSPSKFVLYWSSFLPQSPHQPSLISIIMTDPVHQVRSASAKLLAMMFEGQKNLLKTSTLGSTSKLNTPLPYTPLSLKLKYIIKEIEISLLNSLENETALSTKIQILKTFCVFVQQIPYNENNYEIREKLLHSLINLSYLSKYKDNNLIKTSYRCINLLLTNRLESKDLKNREKNHLIELEIIQMSLNLLDDLESPYHQEIYKILSSIAINYPELIEESFDKIFTYISRDTNTHFTDNIDPMVRLSAIRVIDELTKAILDEERQDLIDFSTKLWRVILESHITTLGNDRFSQIRAVFCNIFSRIHSNTFEMLSTKQQIMMITMILGLTYDENSLVRSQACRTIGVFILNNSLKVNPLFVSDSGVALVKAMKDKNLNVRIRAAWALANLCDSLVVVKESEIENSEDSTPHTDDIPIDILISIAKCAIHATRDNEKVRPNAVRALGNFVRFSSSFLFTEEKGSKSLFSNIISSLIQCTKEGSAKTRWNSCYALGNIFRNKAVLKLDPNSILSAIKVLIFLIKSSKNYKVMINALMALSLPSREYFSSKFIDCFIEISDLIINFEVISEFDDYTSHHYKDNFLIQCINTYIHLINNMTNEDMKDEILQNYLKENREKLFNTLIRICGVDNKLSLEEITQKLENIYSVI